MNRDRIWVPGQNVPIIIMLVMLIVVLVIGGLIWFDVLGIINAGSLFRSFMQSVGIIPEESVRVDYSDFELLDSMELQKRELAIELRLQELGLAREFLARDIQTYGERLSQLEEREEILSESEKSFNQTRNRYDDRKAGLVQNAIDLTNMRPNDAVAILSEYDDQLLIDTLRTIQELAEESGTFSLVATYLSLLPEDRAAAVQRKMTEKPPLQSDS
ncbi:MAG: periplasmic-type flagellar collar protein FlbB [Salinispira sp.]